MKSKTKIIAVVVSLALLALVAGFLIWAQSPALPGQIALAAMQSDAQVRVEDSANYLLFEPVTVSPHELHFLFYPGGHVDPRAYAPLMRSIASHGYRVLVAKVALNMALLDIGAGERVMQAFPNAQTWAAGGHSLGGVAAARMAQTHPEIAGLVFLAAWPADAELRTAERKALAIWGSEDGNVDGGEKVLINLPRFPVDTRLLEITGGNHAGFADYGEQPGDNPAQISPLEQQAQTKEAIVEFFSYITS